MQPIEIAAAGTKRRKLKSLRFMEYKILHIDDTPHKIALGVALGIFIAFSPLIGLHLPLVIVFCMLLRSNKFAALTSVWISNVFTYPFIFYPAFLVGRFLCRFLPFHVTLTSREVWAYLNRLFAPSNMISGFLTRDYWRHFWILAKSIGPELWVGCIFVGGIIAAASYFVSYRMIISHRLKNPHRRYGKF